MRSVEFWLSSLGGGVTELPFLPLKYILKNISCLTFLWRVLQSGYAVGRAEKEIGNRQKDIMQVLVTCPLTAGWGSHPKGLKHSLSALRYQ